MRLPDMDPAVIDYLRHLVVDDIQKVLHDPQFESRQKAEEWNRTVGKTCELLGLDFNAVAHLAGTPYEVQRLNHIIDGFVDPRSS